MNAPVDVLGRAATVLRALSAREPDGATTSELARETGLARPTAHRLLSALLGEGLVDRDPAGRWQLGPELYLLGTAAAARYDVTALAQPSVRRLADATGESAFFSVRRGDETVCLVREDGSFPVRSHVLYAGIRFPLGVASAGLAILAYLPDADVERYLSGASVSGASVSGASRTAAYGPEHTPDAIRDRIAATRRDGYAVNPGLIVEGSWGMGAAVFDARSAPVGALSLTGVAHRFAPHRQPQLGRLLLAEAHRLSTAVR
ncbi:IclR family transcriptional regulator [Cryptosporangium sp. NPDC048952]|uniref:IclR family transcriptional regulator n=1 Tax=Cryptosporangium sp. NPDC048952 TaxID=3363961 RepID=UPI0037148E99